MAKFYAVKMGRQPGIYLTWSEAEKQVKGFPNAKFKSFSTKEAAEHFLSGVPEQSGLASDNGLVAYVDGSFNRQKGQYGSGIVLLRENKVVETLLITGNDSTYIDSFQIAGEVFGCIEAIKWAHTHEESQLTIYYDYQGIESWALGEWQANKPISKTYVEQFRALRATIDVRFKKVKAHTGDTYNEMADQLAKAAANQ
ncbi:ribonuclease H1 domain-containing protein [Enterococcus camelliae]|uniref:ribonuclease H n=1 Tax=Enterococcus camelliae TaxID=453959 RepID=A0ABW5TJP5_9ENTE